MGQSGARPETTVMRVEPYYDDGQVTLYCGDNRELLDRVAVDVDAIVTDPPYGDTSLDWDRTPDRFWLELAAVAGIRSLWCFGSFRFWMEVRSQFTTAGWRYAQEVVWEKHNGSSFHADRFKRVHELAVQWYRGAWEAVYREPQVTHDATARTVRRKRRPPHTGHIEAGSYASEDGGPRLQRSVIYCRSEHGRAICETQKPLGILRPLIAYSVPPGGLVLDPFAGSCSTLRAARELGRRAIGIEAREQMCAKAVDLLAQGVLVA